MALKVLDIQTLIAEGKIVDPGNIDTANAYVSVGLWQPGNRKSGGGNYSYPQFAIKLSDIGTGSQGNPGNQGPTGPIGPVGMTWRGGWSNAVNYAFRDVVYYNGSSYFCTVPIAASNNNPASTPANWELVVLKGATGTTGVQGPPGSPGPVGPAGLNWQGLWSASGTYVADDAVGYNGASYFCINPVGPSPTPPDVDTANWALLAAQGAQGDPGVQGVPGNDGVGIQGPAGPVNTLTIGTVNSAPSPAASITGSAPNQVLNLTLPVGPAGPAGAVTSLVVESGLRNIGDLANPQLRLGQNPLLAQTEIPSGGFNLSLSGTGKLGVGVDLSTGSSTAAKAQVRGNGGASLITGTITGTTFTVTNPLPGGAAFTGTINIGDYVFINTTTGGIAWGTYITASPSPGVYTLNQAVPSPLTATGTLVLPNVGNNIYFSTSPLLLKLEKAGGTGNPSLEVWENGTIRSNELIYDSVTKRLAISNVATSANPFSEYGTNGGIFGARAAVLQDSLTMGNTQGSVTIPGTLQFFRSGFSQIQGTRTESGLALYDINYMTYGNSTSRHRFTGATAVTKTADRFGIFPSAFGGNDNSLTVNGGARLGYSLCVYQPLDPGTPGSLSYQVTGYIIGTKLYVTGCNATGLLPAGWLQVGHTLSATDNNNTQIGIREGTVITNIVTPWDPGVTPVFPAVCVTDQVGEYDLSGAAQTFGSIGSPVSIRLSVYPNWNDSRAMYVDGTIKFVNLPQGAGSAPVGLTAGDIWVDTSAGNVLKMV